MCFFLKISKFFWTLPVLLQRRCSICLICVHTDTEGKQRKARVRNILKSSKKTTIFNEHPVYPRSREKIRERPTNKEDTRLKSCSHVCIFYYVTSLSFLIFLRGLRRITIILLLISYSRQMNTTKIVSNTHNCIRWMH